MVSKVAMGKAVQTVQVPKLLIIVEKQLHETAQLKKTGISQFGLVLPDSKRRKTAGGNAASSNSDNGV